MEVYVPFRDVYCQMTTEILILSSAIAIIMFEENIFLLREPFSTSKCHRYNMSYMNMCSLQGGWKQITMLSGIS